MTRDEATPLAAAHVLVRHLIAEKLKYLVPMTILFMVSYVGLTILAGFGTSWHQSGGSPQPGLSADRAELSSVVGARGHLWTHRGRQV